MIIALDAGHGYNTPGKRTPDDIREWTLNDRVLRAFDKEINTYKGVTTVRLDDPTGKTDVSLPSRTKKAEDNNCDVVISLHHNAYMSVWGNHGGTETILYKGRGNEAFGKMLNNSVVNTLGLRDRGIKYMNFHMVREPKVPAALVEVGFMDSNTDKAIRDADKSALVGKNLARDFAAYYGLSKGTNQGTDKPTGDTGALKIGDEVIVSGVLYTNSGATKAGKTVNGVRTKITRFAPGKAAPYNTTGDLGWVKVSSLTKVGASKPPVTKPPVTKPPVDTGSSTVTVNGRVHRDSAGNGPGRTLSNHKGKITHTKSGAPYPYHIDQLGWVSANAIGKAVSAPKLEIGATVQYSGRVHATSAGARPGRSVSGRYKVTRLNSNSHGVHIDNLGWVRARDCKVI